ncbi:MAG: PfkB family carbohydrate kinase [Clostridium sp.]
MRIKTDITALGELLIDFTPAGVSQQGMRLFEQNPGGAPANLLAAAAKFGRKTAFIGKVGKDMHGDFLKETLIRAGINTDNLIQDEKYFTTLAFVSLKENGEREFAFARKAGGRYESVHERDRSGDPGKYESISCRFPVADR